MTVQHEEKTAAIDADFVNKLLESKLDANENESIKKLIECLAKIFTDLRLKAIIHPLVYDNELLFSADKVKKLFDSGVIAKIGFADVFNGDESKKAYYTFLVEELFYHINGESFPVSGQEVLSYWIAKKNLGEVHSLAMCLVLPCGIFLSDDGHSKQLGVYIKTELNGTVDVYNRNELIDKHLDEAAVGLNRRQRQALTHT